MNPYRLLAVVVALLVLVPTTAVGQQPTHRLSVGIGGATVPDWLDLVSNVLTSFGSLGSHKTKIQSEPLAVSVQYEHFLSDRFALLSAAGVQRISRDVIVADDPAGSMSSTYGHLMGGAAIHYRRGHTLGLYSNAAVGLALNHDSADIDGSASTTETRALPAFQLTALGLRVGHPFSAFLELGFGYRGMAVLGVSYEL